jgi:peptide alpha-N-acetyltransferase
MFCQVHIIEQKALGYLESLRSCRKFHPEGEFLQHMIQFIYSRTWNFADAEWDVQSPTCELWTLHVLAQHFCHLGHFERALQCIGEALEHTPTLIELYIVQGKLYKCAGDITKAAECLNEGRMLDTADRYINCKCAKYMLQSDQVERAEELCSMFTREGASASDTLNEMQCIWFERESALSYKRQGLWGKALQKCYEIERHFVEIFDDQFDFHTYCMRKMTLRAYVELLQVEDRLRSHPFYFDAAQLAIEIYIRLYDKPLVTQNAVDDKLDNMSQQEKKKMLSKQRKAQKKAANKQQSGADTNTTKKDAKEKEVKQTDSEKREFGRELMLIPEELESTKQPLEEALKFLKPLQTLGSGRIETHLLAYRIYCRRKKLLLMLQSVKRAAAIDRNHHELHEHIVDLTLAVAAAENLSRPVSAILHTSLPALLDTPNVQEFNSRFLQSHSKSLPHLLSGCLVWYKLQPEKVDEIIKLVTGLSDDLTDRTVKWCSVVLDALQRGEFGAVPEAAENYKRECHKLFPFATAFKPKNTDSAAEELSTESYSLEPENSGTKPPGQDGVIQ